MAESSSAVRTDWHSIVHTTEKPWRFISPSSEAEEFKVKVCRYGTASQQLRLASCPSRGVVLPAADGTAGCMALERLGIFHASASWWGW